MKARPMRRTGESRASSATTQSRPQVVPYISAWSAELVEGQELVQTRRGIRYGDETLTDRDRYGALWHRWTVARGAGTPWLAQVHPLRQRRAMRKGLCQVFGTPADRDEKLGWLFLLPNDGKNGSPEGEHTTHPPVSRRGGRIAVSLCPPMHDAIVVRVKEYVPVGVWGSQYRAGPFGPIRIGEGPVLFDDPALPWCLAEQLLVELRGCTVVDREAGLGRQIPGSRAEARR